MQKDQFEYLQSLLTRAFETSCEVLTNDLQKAEPQATRDQIHAEIVREYPLAALANRPKELEAALGLMAAQGVFATEDGIDTQSFFVGMLEMVRGVDQEHANESAGRILLILSERYSQIIKTPADGLAFN